jgi:hypothetical protein
LVLGGGSAPIVWIGRRSIDCSRHPTPDNVWPVQVNAHAFGPGLPARDLFLSPDHAIYVDDVLIPVGRLVNGTSIVRVPSSRVTYYHVELPMHDVLLAEGLPTESYLDTGDRSNFDDSDGAIRLFPDFSRRAPNVAALWEVHGCAPLVLAGPKARATMARIDRLAAIGFDERSRAAGRPGGVMR